MQKAQFAFTAVLLIAVIGFMALIAMGQNKATALAEAQVAALEKAANADAEARAASMAALEKAAAGMADLAAAMREPRPVEAEAVGDAVNAAVMLSQLTDNQTRNYAAYILGRLGGEEAETRLIDMARNDPDTSTSQAAFQALQNMNSEKVGAIAIEQLKSNNPRRKQAAASVLSQIATHEMVPDLNAVLLAHGGRDNQVEQIRYYLYRALQRLGDPRSCEALSRALQFENDDYRRNAALLALMACADSRHVPTLIKALDSLGDPNTNTNARWSEVLQAIEQLGDPRLAPFAASLVTNDNNYNRRQAFEALQRLRDPSVAPDLLKAWTSADGATKKELDQFLDKGYPGIVKAKDGEGYSLVPDEEMNPLMAEREERIRQLIEQAKVRQPPGKEEGGGMF